MNDFKRLTNLTNQFFRHEDVEKRKSILAGLQDTIEMFDELPPVLNFSTFQYLARYSIKAYITDDVPSLNKYFNKRSLGTIGDVHLHLLNEIEKHEAHFESRKAWKLKLASIEALLEKHKHHPEFKKTIEEIREKWNG